MMNSRPNRRDLLCGLGIAVAGLAVAGCNTNAPVDAEGRIRIRLAAPGPARAEHAGFYQAIANSFYAKRGLNVQISHGNSSSDVSAHLANGTAELGLLNDSYAALRLIGDRAPVKAVAAFFQKDPRVLIARASDAPRDLASIGDRELFIEDANWSDIWSWLQKKYSLAADQLKRPEEGAIQPFLDTPESLLIGSLTREPAQVETSNPDLATRLFLPADEGYASYSAILMAPNGFARDNTKALQDFIAASVEGWHSYLTGNSDPAHALIRRANPATPQGSLDAARELLKQYSIVDGGDAALYGLGAMTDDRWKAFAEQSADSYSAEVDWQSAFTTAYLPARK